MRYEMKKLLAKEVWQEK